MSLPPPTPERDEPLEYINFDDEQYQRAPQYEDTAHHETFVEIMKALPVAHVRAADVQHPRQLLSCLLGRVSEEFLMGIGDVRAASHQLDERVDWAEVMELAAQVGGSNAQHFFNKLLTPEQSVHAPCSVNFKDEYEYLTTTCALPISRKYDVIGELFDRAGPYDKRVRMEWTAALIKLVHLCVAIYRPSMRTALGRTKVLEQRREAAAQDVRSYMHPREAVRLFTRGEVFDVDMFIYETLLAIACPEACLSKYIRTTNLLCLAEYHAVRCAVDACSPSTLNICLMSPSYLRDVWYPYMQLYYPRMFVVEEEKDTEEVRAYREASVLPQWSTLVFYAPNKHQCAEQNPKDFIPFLQQFFVQALTPEFRASFSKIVMGPRDYFLLCTAPGEVFSTKAKECLAWRRPARQAAMKRARTH